MLLFVPTVVADFNMTTVGKPNEILKLFTFVMATLLVILILLVFLALKSAEDERLNILPATEILLCTGSLLPSYDIITKEYNGTLKVVSQEGQGSELTVTIPL